MKLFIFMTICIVTSVATTQAKTISIATDENKWHPYSYEDNGVAMGIHIDMVTLALKNLGYNATLTPLPWMRCLISTQKGWYDALISASYQPKRAKLLYYPPGAATDELSDYRISQVTYVIVSNLNNYYEFNGDVKTLPYPLMAPFGYSVVDDLEKEGITVFETSGDMSSFKILLARQGCIVTLPEIANMMMKKPEYKNKLYISKRPFKSKSYFLVFSKKTNISKNERKRIWEEVKKVRNNKTLRIKLLKKYYPDGLL